MRKVMLGLGTAVVCFSTIFMGGVSHAAKPSSEVRHVVIIGYDGLAACQVDWSRVPTLNRLRTEGKWTLHSRSVVPSASAINWATLMMGAPSEMHGFRTWGSKKPDLKPIAVTKDGLFPCIFSVVRDQIPDAYTVSAWNWDGIAYIHQTNAVSKCKDFSKGTRDQMVNWFLKQLDGRPTLSFLYFAQPDGTGHSQGWESEDYKKAVSELDVSLGKVIGYLEKNDWMKDTVVVFVSDHGGINKGHGGQTMNEMETPFILWGKGIQPGEMKGTMMGFDVAPTIAEMLNLKEPDAWRGRSALNR